MEAVLTYKLLRTGIQPGEASPGREVGKAVIRRARKAERSE